MKPKYVKYDLDLLNAFCNKNQIILSQTYSLTDKLNVNSRIKGCCKTENCNEKFNRTFRRLILQFAYCDKCVKNITKETRKKTCLEKFGCEYATQNIEFKQKVKETCLEKYGCEYAAQSIEFKQKVKETCLEKYGVDQYGKTKECQEKIKKMCLEKFGCEYASQNEEIKKKIVKTNLEKFGCEYASQNEEIKKKIVKTNLEKFGGHPSSNEEIKEKIVKTNLEKYGVKYGVQCEEVKGKIKDTMIKKYNCEYPLQHPYFSEKFKQTCLEKYGVEYPMQNSIFAEKQMNNSLNLKDFTFPSGKIIQCQGYEPFGLKELIENEKIDEADILTDRGDVPNIWYFIEDDVKPHRHYVDIFIPSQNRCIEIKSEYTFSKFNDNNHILLKQESGKKDGYLYEIWVFDKNGIRTKIFN